MTDTARWERLRTLFHGVRRLDAAEREPYLRERCADDPGLRDEVEALLASHESEDESFLEPLDRNALLLASGVTPSPLPDRARVGRYEIIELLATGGMGEVYLARRADAAYEKKVAVKIIRRSIATPGLLQRFQHERQALALLDHPGISRLLDGGTTDDGLPFLVMEYIDGIAITDYCDAHRLDTTERLALFRAVCDAAMYAHRNLIVHRDIKPGNVLVTEDGEVKLLDFGLARLLDDPAEIPASPATATRTTAMTPEYSSPEQLRGEPVTTATDVYSLGVVLYELLVGRRPFHLDGVPRYEAERIICEVDPTAPSMAVRAAAESDTHDPVVGPRDTGQRTWPGDLDNIVLMALRKEPSRRYASVDQLAADLDRYDRGLPVLAVPDTLRYRTRKFVTRHRPHVIMGGVAAAAVLAAFVGITLGLLRANAERANAIEARRDALGVVEYIETMLASASPFVRGRTVSVQDLLDDGESLIREELGGRPGVEASVRLALGRTYRRLLLYDRAIPHLEKALAHFRATRDPMDPLIAECLSMLGSSIAEAALERGERTDGVITMQAEALAIRRVVYGEEHPLVAESMRDLGLAVWSDDRTRRVPDEVVQHVRDAIAMHERLGSSESHAAAGAHLLLGHALSGRHEVEEAEQAFRRALTLYERQPGPVDQNMLNALEALGLFLERNGRVDEALAVFETVIERSPRETVLWTAKNARWHITLITLGQGAVDEGCVAMNDALLAECTLLTLDRPDFAAPLRGVLDALERGEGIETPLAVLAEALPVFIAIRADRPDRIWSTLFVFANVAGGIAGDDAVAELLRSTSDALRPMLPAGHPVFDEIDRILRQLESR